MAAFILLAGGCKSHEDPGGHYGTTSRHGKPITTFYVNNLGEPEYVDPGKAHDTTSSKLINHLFEGLVAYGPDSKPVAGVANRYERSKDNRFYRFHLRDNAKWNDGKKVTAQDFEYAFKRVLDPKTGSQSAANLYAFKNGEAVNQGKLKVLASETSLFDAPTASARSQRKLAAGTAFDILAESPVAVKTSVAPFEVEPVGSEGISYDKPDASGKTSELLTILRKTGNETRGPDEKARLPEGDYDVLAMRGEVVCNGQLDHFFEISVQGGNGKKALLPGCMLGASKSEAKRALVAEHKDLPSFVERPAPEESEAPAPIGFVDLSALVSDTSVVGVRATDEQTLEFELAYPVPYMLDILCSATAAPVRRDVVERFLDEPDRWTRPENIVTNGPYQIDKWRFRYEIRTNRNPHHRYFEKLKIHDIVWMSVESLVSGMNLYKAGELDYIGDNGTLPPNYIPSLRKKQDFRLTNYLATYWYEINTRKPPLDNPKVRRALNLAIDKRQLVDKVLLADQTPASHFVPDFVAYGYAEAAKRDRESGNDPLSGPGTGFDPELARKLLGEAGFSVRPDGEGYRAEGMAPLELLYNTSEGHKKLAVAIQDMWKRHLGVSVTLRNEEWKVMLKNVRDGNFQIVRFGWVGDFNHPQTFMDTFMSKSPNNRTGWSSAEFDRLVKEARQTGDQELSIKLYRQAEQVLVDEVPKIPLYFYTKSTLVKPYVKGFFFNERNEQLVHWMWIDENWQKNTENAPAFAPEQLPVAGVFTP